MRLVDICSAWATKGLRFEEIFLSNAFLLRNRALPSESTRLTTEQRRWPRSHLATRPLSRDCRYPKISCWLAGMSVY